MGSPLSPVIANFFMGDFEKKTIEQEAHKHMCRFRYVDDTFVIWTHGQETLNTFTEPPHWTTQQYAVHNGNRRKRPPSVLGQ
jgi:hypothetical protein